MADDDYTTRPSLTPWTPSGQVPGYVPGYTPALPRDMTDPAADAQQPTGWSTDNGKTVFIARPDNTLEIRTGGTLSWRNNNPGNLEAIHPNASGAIGANQSYGRHFAIFNSPSEGAQAQQDLLFGPKFRNQTIAGTIQSYAPEKDGNDPDAYTGYIARRTGMDPGTVLNDMTEQQRGDFMDAIRAYEGLTEGNSAVYNYGASDE